jgi:AAA domain
MQRHIIVSGIPASGKSTVGHAVAAALGFPILDKDEILEALFDTEGTGNAEWRTRLSRAADKTLQEMALRSNSAVITSWWRHPLSRVNSGTPVEWLSSLPGLVVELHCVCSPQVAAERFLARKRHEGHLDYLKTPDEVLTGLQEHAALGPLGIGRLVMVSTEQSVDLTVLLAQIDFQSKSML